MTTHEKNKLLINGFIESVNKYKDNYALDINNTLVTYSELKNNSLKIAGCILSNTSPSNPFVAILADRSLSAYSGILGALFAGKAYVPLNPKFPLERSYYMCDFSSIDTFIVGQECYDYFRQLLLKINKTVIAIFPETNKIEDLRKECPLHKFFGPEELNLLKESNIPINSNPDTTAYMLFTSGSTGIPKAVPISNSNAASYIDYISGKYDFNESDKFYQVSDLTFDLSVQDLFLCWKVGACLCAPNDNTITAIPKFIKNKKLTVWFSVPSVAILFSKMRLLKPGVFPSLRYSMFCGESLYSSTAEAWQSAAPDSVVINFYGPTETTIAISHYKWNKNKQDNNCINGITPLGKIFETQKYCIIDDNFNTVKKNNIGELCLSGTQVTKGYFKNIENTEKYFVKIPSRTESMWYRTGDRVMADEDDCLYFFGRTDNEVKIKGYRVNLLEIDNTISSLFVASMVATVAVPNPLDGVYILVSFISLPDKEHSKNEADILNHCKQFLPAYMIPEKIMFIDEIPLNNNGKIDRKMLLEKYEAL